MIELTQNNVSNVDRKPGTANRLQPVSLSTANGFQRCGQMLSFDTSEELQSQNDVIINQDLGYWFLPKLHQMRFQTF